MKRIAIFFTALALLATGCNKGQEFTLTGDLESAGFKFTPEALILQSDALDQLVTIPVKDGAFSYTGKVSQATAATLKGSGEGKTFTQMVVLEKGTITFDDGYPCGTKLNDASSELGRAIRQAARDSNGDRAAATEVAVKAVRDYLSEHGKDASAVLALMRAKTFCKPDVLSELIDMTSPAVQNDGHIRQVSNQLTNYKKRAEQAD